MADILLLEDDQGLRLLVETGLRDMGHVVHSAGTTRDAIRIVREKRPDVLVLDLMIGRDTSLEVAEVAAYTVPDADVIFATGSGLFPSGELFDIVRNTGWVLRKPIKLKDLNDIVHYSVARPTSEVPLKTD